MKAIRYHGGVDLRVEDVAALTPQDGEVVVDVVACGVCGSDLHFLDGTARPSRTPITLGHEIAGVVATSDDERWPPGAPVVIAAGLSCLVHCRWCLGGRPNLCDQVRMTGIDFDGGWAEQLVISADALISRPAELDAAVAGVAADAGATAFHAIARRGAVAEGMSIAIIGVGGLGTFAVQIAKRLGAAPVIAVDTSPAALGAAKALGADVVVNAAEVDSVGRQIKVESEGGVDVAAEFVGAASTVDDAVKSLRRGGVAVAVGIGSSPLVTIPPTLWAMSEYELRGSFGSLPGDTELVLEWLAGGQLAPPALKRISLSDAPGAILEAAAGRPSLERLVIEP